LTYITCEIGFKLELIQSLLVHHELGLPHDPELSLKSVSSRHQCNLLVYLIVFPLDLSFSLMSSEEQLLAYGVREFNDLRVVQLHPQMSASHLSLGLLLRHSMTLLLLMRARELLMPKVLGSQSLLDFEGVAKGVLEKVMVNVTIVLVGYEDRLLNTSYHVEID
jgi:hypothetical protein